MARRSKNTVSYFPHIIKQGKAMFYIRRKFKNDGYAVWYMLLEKLGETEYHYLDLSDDVQIMYLASEFGVSENLLNEIIEILVKFGEFDAELWKERTILWNGKFIENIQDAYKRRSNECITYENLLILINDNCIHKSDNSIHKSEKSIHKLDLCSDNVDINTHTILDKNIVDNIRQDNTIKDKKFVDKKISTSKKYSELIVFNAIKEKFLNWYIEMEENQTNSAYYFEAKDGKAIKNLIKKIEFKITDTGTHQVNDKNIILGFTHVLKNINDSWLRENISLTMLNSKFNEIFTKKNNGKEQISNLLHNIKEALGEN